MPLDPRLQQPVVKPILHHPTRTFSNCLYFLCHKAVWGLCTIHHLCYVNLCSSPPCCSMRNPFLRSDVPICFMVLLYLSSLPEVCLTINTKTRRKKKKRNGKINSCSKFFYFQSFKDKLSFSFAFLQFTALLIYTRHKSFNTQSYSYASGNRSYFF